MVSEIEKLYKRISKEKMSLKPVPMQPAATTDEAQATGGSGFISTSVEKNSVAITALTISEQNQADRLAAGRG